MSIRDESVLPVRRGPGRPADSDGELTKQEILRVARHLFATHGYTGTTTRMIAAEVGVTPAALHHYYGRKLNLVLTLWRTTTEAEYERLNDAIDQEEGFVEKAQALIEATLASLRADRAATQFIVSIREEAKRTTELAEIVEDDRLAKLVRKLVKFGVDTGVVDPARAAQVRGAIGAMALGATVMASDIAPRQIDQMVDGCKAILAGTAYTLGKTTAKASRR